MSDEADSWERILLFGTKKIKKDFYAVVYMGKEFDGYFF